LLKQAVSLHQAGNLAEAERAYERVLAADPKNFPAQYHLALLLYQSRRLPAAVRAAEAALKLNPESREAHVLHSVLLLNAGALDQALASISRVTARDPRDAEAWHNRAAILAQMHRLDEAVASYDHVLAVRPGDSITLCTRGNVLMELKRYADAIADYDRGLAQSPDVFDAWSNRGLALYELERFTEALESYDRALTLRPQSAPAWANRGKVLAGLQRFDEALASYDKALSLSPDYLEGWRARALVLRTMHRFDEALVCVDKALAIDGGWSPAHFLRGWLLCEINRIADGLATIRLTAERDLGAKPGGGPAPPAHKQRHDAEQREYLAGRGVARAEGGVHFVESGRLAGRAVNPGNVASAAADWEKSRPRLVVIDDFLTGEALQKLRDFCWGSTVWRQSYDSGYLGAMPEQGFASPLLAQIAEELRDTFPTIVGDNPLRMLWGFKYDSRLKGIGIHADQAAVNVNFWITPDDANRNPESGGMVIWDVAAPTDWDAKKYNGDEPAVRAFLARTGAKPVKVPYRANRAVIFDSDLFHETDTIEFNEGYLNRRINVTMLYGRRTYFGS
jgi:tetratricopeptide (TPR) repeat protein